ncbi:MAG TPA: 3-oxoacyl-ACP synthase III family protein [Flavitalea sp.]|nr:3-oxoacyl-ACP synthase III family protein [Flavitalea sp.]
MARTVIIGTGSYIPTVIKKNSDFLKQAFYAEDNTLIPQTQRIIEKFEKITGIAERRYISDDLRTSDIGTLAGKLAIEDSGIDPETLDLIIVAHNFGDVRGTAMQIDTVPSLANRVKQLLGIKNPRCIAFDTLFGCPGWILGVMQADAFFKAGMAKKALVIGAETLSRIFDVHDRDSMIFSDGAGAVVLEYKECSESGILSTSALSHSDDETYYLSIGNSYGPGSEDGIRYMKMKGRKVYEYALKYVPEAMKACLEESGVSITELKKIIIHQANEKMDEAIVEAMYKLFGVSKAPEHIMPMCIHFLGNSSVATIPTLYDLVLKGQMENQALKPGDVILFASVGAGMNINAICYRV